MTEPLKNRKIALALVVDDDPSLTMLVTASLKSNGIDVIVADTGKSGVDRFKAELPDIVLMDALMPDMDGFSACKAIRDFPEGKFTQILMVTGLEDTESVENAFEAGANGFISKPLNLVTLGQQVQYMLRAGMAFRELHINESRLAKTQKMAKIGDWQLNIKTGEFHCSGEARLLLGLAERGPDITLDAFFAPVVFQDKERVAQVVEKTLKQNKSTTLEYQVHRADGSPKHILNTSEIVYDEYEQSSLMLGIVQDISQLKEAEAEARYYTFYDSLTGLPNRMLFLDRLEQIIVRAARNNECFALLFLGLDHFKRINDTLGHHVGDQLLIKVSDVIKDAVRGSDSATRIGGSPDDTDFSIARLGGDEFAILLSDLKTPESAANVVGRFLDAISAIDMIEGIGISPTASIGISVFPGDGDQADVLLKNADTAMSHAKKEGRNRYQFFMDSMNKAVLERFSIDRDLRKALTNNEFVLYYQPQLDIATRQVTGAEALIRWFPPGRGMIPPDKFIPVAEESGMIVDINRWVIRTACEQAEKWRQKGLPPIRIGVNLSGYKLASQGIVDTIEKVLDGIRYDARNIEIEITENILMQDTNSIVSILNRIKNLNLRIALDDFGTGYSSLSYLTSFPVDTIKIDRSFVMGSQSDPNNLVIIKAIIAMGHSLGKEIVAEGIETLAHYQCLKELGCDLGQGYFFHRPVPIEEFEKILTDSLIPKEYRLCDARSF